MIQKNLIFFVVFFCCVSFSFAQENTISNALNKNVDTSLVRNNKVMKKSNIKIWQGWNVGLNFGVTKFNGDISQYDYYPAFQEEGNFFELKTAMSFNLEKTITPLYSISAELSNGKFSGMRRPAQYSNYDVYDPYQNYEGSGDKFITSFSELDLLLNLNLSNLMSYFGNSRVHKKTFLTGKIGFGYNIFNTVRKNLFSDTYINSLGYSVEGSNSDEINKKFFLNQSKSKVYIYGFRANYRLNSKINLNMDYTIRNTTEDTWDASLMSTQYKTDYFALLSFGASYNIGYNDYNNDWTSPIDVLNDDVLMLGVRIEGFTDDTDNDGIADGFDKSPNTPLGVPVDGSGIALDVDMDNVPDYRDADPFSLRGVFVDINGVELDDDKDGVPNSKDLECNSPLGTTVNQFGVNLRESSSSGSSGVIYFPSIYFNSGSTIVGKSNNNRIAIMALLLKNNQYIKLNVIGHTDRVGDVNSNDKLGLQRANAVIRYLILNYNIEPNRLFAITKGEEDPLSSIHISDKAGVKLAPKAALASINRRVDFQIKK